MVFKTYDGDKFSEMIGGNKRSFAQIKKDIDEAVRSVEEGGSRFKAGMSAFSSAPKNPLIELSIEDAIDKANELTDAYNPLFIK